MHQCIRVTIAVLGWQVRLKRLAGDTDVDVGIVVAVGTLVACDRVGQTLTCRWTSDCHSPADARMVAANKAAFSITGVA